LIARPLVEVDAIVVAFKALLVVRVITLLGARELLLGLRRMTARTA
jgi:hypothetical protein